MSWVSFVGLLSGWNLEGILVYLWFKYVCVCVCLRMIRVSDDDNKLLEDNRIINAYKTRRGT